MKKKATNATINVRGTEVAVVHNSHFNSGEFATTKSQAGLNSYKQDTRDAAA